MTKVKQICGIVEIPAGTFIKFATANIALEYVWQYSQTQENQTNKAATKPKMCGYRPRVVAVPPFLRWAESFMSREIRHKPTPPRFFWKLKWSCEICNVWAKTNKTIKIFTENQHSQNCKVEKCAMDWWICRK